MNQSKNNKFQNITFHTFGKYLFLLLALSFVFCLSAEAGNKEKKSKKKKIEIVTTIEPDPVGKKARPDSHPKSHEAPSIIYFKGNNTHGLEGMDISHYQGKIDWSQLATDSHAGFVYLKATEGNELADNTYQHNLDEAHKYGIKVGSYHFFRPNVSAVSQFNNIKRTIDPRQQDLLPVVDVEVMPKGLSVSKFHECLFDLLKLMEEEYGRKPLIYTGKNFYNKYFHGTHFSSNYKFWIANYTDIQPVLSGNDDYLMWQYSSKGKVKGIKGFVDLNRFVGRHVLKEIKF